MTLGFRPADKLRQLCASNRQDTQDLNKRVRDSRSMIAETRRVLADPMWGRMAAPCPPWRTR